MHDTVADIKYRKYL